MDQSKRIEYRDLTQFCVDALLAVGVPEHVAQIEGEIAAEVDLHGVHSHGVRLLLNVIDNVRHGLTNPDPQLEMLVDFPASVLAETERGIGRYVSAVGMDMAVARAEQYGIAAATIRGVGHWGRGHSYALRAARRGMIGLAFTNAIANFPAWGTAEPSLGNNPLALGVPGEEGGEPAVLDIAMTQTAIGRVRQAAAAGRTIPLGWGLDANGDPTDDPDAVLESGRFLPMGEHKGSGLAFMTDLLTAGLGGGLLCYEQGTLGRPSDTEGGSTKLFIAIKPFGDWLGERVAALKAHIHAVQPAPEQGEVRWPGESSYRRRDDYLVHGIRIEAPLAADMQRAAAELGTTLHWR
jgi:LDH2 family malate/lactate/ureidoglycolate dehydrogenase